MIATPRHDRQVAACERADQELHVLDDVILCRHAREGAAWGEHRPDVVDPRDDEQRGARGEEPAEHPVALRRAAELDDQQRDDQQLQIGLGGTQRRRRARHRPGDAEKHQRAEQDRQAGGRIGELAAQLGEADRRHQRDEPERRQDAGRRGRPRKRDRDGDGEPFGHARRARRREQSGGHPRRHRPSLAP